MIEISRVQAWAFRCPTEIPVATSFGIMHDRPAVIVRVEDREGAFGWGEIWANWPAAGAEHRARLLEMDVAHLLIGMKAERPEDIFRRLDAQTQIRAVQCGEIGPFAQVIAGLDIAIWDLAARRADLPLRHLIRAEASDQVPAYASGIPISAADDMLPAARTAGHQRFKLKVGFDMVSDIADVRRLQSGLATKEFIACDANQAWTLGQAQSFVAGLRDTPLHWLEEPIPVFTDAAKWRELSEMCSIPLAGGENIIGEPGFASAIEDGALSVIQPDVAKWGGITGCLAVAKQALAEGRRYFPHFLGAGVGLTASAELLAGVGGDGFLEVDINANPLRSMFFEDGRGPVKNGDWQCTEKPGLGIEFLPEGLDQFQTIAVEVT